MLVRALINTCTCIYRCAHTSTGTSAICKCILPVQFYWAFLFAFCFERWIFVCLAATLTGTSHRCIPTNCLFWARWERSPITSQFRASTPSLRHCRSCRTWRQSTDAELTRKLTLTCSWNTFTLMSYVHNVHVHVRHCLTHKPGSDRWTCRFYSRFTDTCRMLWSVTYSLRIHMYVC